MLELISCGVCFFPFWLFKIQNELWSNFLPMCFCLLPWTQEKSPKGRCKLLWCGMDSCNLPAGPQGHITRSAANSAQEVLCVLWHMDDPAWMKEISVWVKRSIRGKMRVILMSHLPSGAIFCGSLYLLLGKMWGVGKITSGLSPPGLAGCVHEWVIQAK